jgi:hypothetical protein
MKSFNQFRTELDEISLKTKVGAYRKMKHQARKQLDPQGREGHYYHKPEKREKALVTTKNVATKALNRRATRFLKKIEKGHGAKAAGQAKHGSDVDAKKYGKDQNWGTHMSRWDRKSTDKPKIMKGGPRKGKMDKDAIEKSKMVARMNIKRGKYRRNPQS